MNLPKSITDEAPKLIEEKEGEISVLTQKLAAAHRELAVLRTLRDVVEAAA